MARCIVIGAVIVVMVLLSPLLLGALKDGEGHEGEAANGDTSAAEGSPLDTPISLHLEHSPGGGRLTVQFAVKAVCEAAGLSYDWDKSQRLAGDDCKRFMAPVAFDSTLAREALDQILAPLGLTYALDDQTLHLRRR